MKKLISIVMTISILMGISAPCFAADTPQKNPVYTSIEELPGDVTVVTEIFEINSAARSSETDGTARKTYYDRDDNVIAVIAITGTFSYDGSTVKVASKSITREDTYDGWKFSKSSFTGSGGTIRLSGKLTKTGETSVSVSLSLTCDKNGNIS